jgi:hypothetical protein
MDSRHPGLLGGVVGEGKDLIVRRGFCYPPFLRPALAGFFASPPGAALAGSDSGFSSTRVPAIARTRDALIIPRQQRFHMTAPSRGSMFTVAKYRAKAVALTSAAPGAAVDTLKPGRSAMADDRRRGIQKGMFLLDADSGRLRQARLAAA